MNETARRKPWSLRHPLITLAVAVVVIIGAAFAWPVIGILWHATTTLVSHG